MAYRSFGYRFGSEFDPVYPHTQTNLILTFSLGRVKMRLNKLKTFTIDRLILDHLVGSGRHLPSYHYREFFASDMLVEVILVEYVDVGIQAAIPHRFHMNCDEASKEIDIIPPALCKMLIILLCKRQKFT